MDKNEIDQTITTIEDLLAQLSPSQRLKVLSAYCGECGGTPIECEAKKERESR